MKQKEKLKSSEKGKKRKPNSRLGHNDCFARDFDSVQSLFSLINMFGLLTKPHNGSIILTVSKTEYVLQSELLMELEAQDVKDRWPSTCLLFFGGMP